MIISDFLKMVRMKQLGISESQILDCVSKPTLKGSESGVDIYARKINGKILICSCKGDLVITADYTDMAGDISNYTDAIQLWKIASSAGGQNPFYTSGSGFEVFGDVRKD